MRYAPMAACGRILSSVTCDAQRASLLAAVLLAAAVSDPLGAQQRVPFRNNTPVAPQGLRVLGASRSSTPTRF